MIDALYFDGRTAASRPVGLSINDGRVRVTGLTEDRDELLAAVVIGDRIGAAPRFVWFSDGAHCEIADVEAFTQMLDAHGVPASRVSSWEQKSSAVAAALVGLIVAALAIYFVVLPAVADAIVTRMSRNSLDRLSHQSLRWLDAYVLEPTALPAPRRAFIVSAFEGLNVSSTGTRWMRLEFRQSARLGPNALALPSGTIILTDELVSLLQDHREILAVLSHEAGHVIRGHGPRRLAQASALSVLISWYLGDVSSLAATAPALLLEARYSREFEREADDFAAEVLRSNGMAIVHLVNALKRMEAAAAERGLTAAKFGYLSSHPATSERLARLRELSQR